MGQSLVQAVKPATTLTALALLLATISLLYPTGLQGSAVSEEDGRTVELRSQGISIQVPFRWQLSINERAPEGDAVFSAQGVNDQGQRTTTSINLRFSTREAGNEYPLPDPEAYADALLATLRTLDYLSNFELISAETVQRAGVTGTLVEYTFKAQGVPVRSRTLSLIATDPPRLFIFSYGSREDQWDDDIENVEAIISSIEIE